MLRSPTTLYVNPSGNVCRRSRPTRYTTKYKICKDTAPRITYTTHITPKTFYVVIGGFDMSQNLRGMSSQFQGRPFCRVTPENIAQRKTKPTTTPGTHRWCCVVVYRNICACWVHIFKCLLIYSVAYCVGECRGQLAGRIIREYFGIVKAYRSGECAESGDWLGQCIIWKCELWYNMLLGHL